MIDELIRLVNHYQKFNHECVPLERGEIYIKGPHVSPGYLSNSSNTNNSHNDWLHTGDIGYFDNDGYLFLVGRKDDMIILKNFNLNF